MSDQNPETSTAAEPDFEWGPALGVWVTEKLERMVDLLRAGDIQAAHRHALAVEFVLPLLKEHAGMDGGGMGSAALRALRLARGL